MKLFFIFLLFTLTGCKLILGIHEPEIVTKEKLDKYLISLKIDTTNSCVFYKPAFDSLEHQPYKPNWPVGFRPIQFKVFNAKGKIISQYASCEGSYKKLKILDSNPPRNVFPFDSTLNLNNDLNMYRTFSGEMIPVNAADYDLTFVVYWGEWMGIFGKRMLKDVYSYKKNHPELKINILKVNVAEFFVISENQPSPVSH